MAKRTRSESAPIEPPVVGDRMYFHHNGTTPYLGRDVRRPAEEQQPNAAMITFVHDLRRVNARVWGHEAQVAYYDKILIVHPGDEPPPRHTPYLTPPEDGGRYSSTRE